MENPKYDYSLLNYIDITSEIKKGVKQSNHPASLMYFFNNPDTFDYGANSQLLKRVGVDVQMLRARHNMVVQNFLEFRGEKNIVKSIKFKS